MRLLNALSAEKKPAIDEFNALLQEYTRRGMDARAMKLIATLKRTGVALDRHSHDQIISLHARNGRVAQMEQALAQMAAAGHPRSALTCACGSRTFSTTHLPRSRRHKSLFVGYVKGKLLNKAQHVWVEMERSGKKPDLRVSESRLSFVI
jgi:pentatricopeptide repeat protein